MLIIIIVWLIGGYTLPIIALMLILATYIATYSHIVFI